MKKLLRRIWYASRKRYRNKGNKVYCALRKLVAQDETFSEEKRRYLVHPLTGEVLLTCSTLIFELCGNKIEFGLLDTENHFEMKRALKLYNGWCRAGHPIHYNGTFDMWQIDFYKFI